jgi:thiosulfate/3-mercaptopyruvate sulfurtransferase
MQTVFLAKASKSVHQVTVWAWQARARRPPRRYTRLDMKKSGHSLRLHYVCMLIITAMFASTVSIAQNRSASDLAPGSAELIPAQQLLKQLQSGTGKPIVLYVGPRFLYAQAHIRGAEYVGPTAEPQALENLRKRTAALPKNSSIVLYCGCCPWDHCPNIRPAYKELHEKGFTGVKVLYLADSFGADWVEKGYPVEKGQ